LSFTRPARARVVIEAAQPGQLVGDLGFDPARHRLVPARLRHTIGQIGFAGRVGVRLVVGVAVGVAVGQTALNGDWAFLEPRAPVALLPQPYIGLVLE
jgi:hypothetical protein